MRFQKYQKGFTKKTNTNTLTLSNGKYAIISIDNYRLPAKTIEAVRRVISRKLKRQGQIWICVYPDLPVTKKPAEVRMGKGKGKVNYWCARISKGHILFEIDGVAKQQAYEAYKLVRKKLPFDTLFISEN